MRGGTENTPRTLIVIDELSKAAPKPISSQAAKQGATGVLTSLLQLRRSAGAILVLGAQKPKDVDIDLTSFSSSRDLS